MIREWFSPGWIRGACIWLALGSAASVMLPLRNDLLGWSAVYWLAGAPLLVLAVLHWRAAPRVNRAVPTAFVACGARTRA